MARLATLLVLLAVFAPMRAGRRLFPGCASTRAAVARLLPRGAVAGRGGGSPHLPRPCELFDRDQGRASAVTDYNAYVTPPYPPRIATMNNAHDTHYTERPDPRIEHVLRGWNPNGGWAEHDLIVADLRVRNIPTAVRGRFGEQELSNSIFVFEVEDLCIAHLGHLHHRLTSEQRAELGEIDVLLAPVDGSYTMSQEEMLAAIEDIRPKMVIPMHYFGPTVLNRFLALAEAQGWRIERRLEPVLELARDRLVERTIVVLPGR